MRESGAGFRLIGLGTGVPAFPPQEPEPGSRPQPDPLLVVSASKPMSHKNPVPNPPRFPAGQLPR